MPEVRSIPPIIRLQRFVRTSLLRRKRLKYSKLRKCISVLQAHIRRFLNEARIRKEMNKILYENGLGHLVKPKRVRKIKRTPIEIIGTFCKKLMRLRSQRWTIIRLQKWWRIKMERRMKELSWFKSHAIQGIVIAASHIDFVHESLRHLQNFNGNGVYYPSKDLMEIVKITHLTNIFMWERVTRKNSTWRPSHKVESATFQWFRATEKAHPHQKGIINSLYQHHVSSVIAPLARSVGYSSMMAWVDVKTRNIFRRIRSRGQSLFRHEVEAIRSAMFRCVNLRAKTLTPLILVNVSCAALLVDLFNHLQTVLPNTRTKCVFLDVPVFQHSAATLIQSAFRAVKTRRKYSVVILGIIIRQRATILLQRWWRSLHGLLRRLRLLDRISLDCRNVTSSVLFMDCWAFYSLIRLKRLPQIPSAFYLFPEFRGVPGIDSNDRASFFNFSADVDTVIDMTGFRGEASSSAPSSLRGNIKSQRNGPDRRGELNFFGTRSESGDVVVSAEPSEDDLVEIGGPPSTSVASPVTVPMASSMASLEENSDVEPALDLQQSQSVSANPETAVSMSLQPSEISLPMIDDKYISELMGTATTRHDLLSFNSNLRVRFGIPQWAPWRPRQQQGLLASSDSITSRAQAQYTLYDLLTVNVDVAIVSVAPLLSEEQIKKIEGHILDPRLFGLKIVKLQFASLAEAKVRRALVALATYESQSREYVHMVSMPELLSRLDSRAFDFGNILLQQNQQNMINSHKPHEMQPPVPGLKSSQHKQMRSDEHIAPLEMSFLLNPIPIALQTSHVVVGDVVRFRYMVDSLAVMALAEGGQLAVGSETMPGVEAYDQFFNATNYNVFSGGSGGGGSGGGGGGSGGGGGGTYNAGGDVKIMRYVDESCQEIRTAASISLPPLSVLKNASQVSFQDSFFSGDDGGSIQSDNMGSVNLSGVFGPEDGQPQRYGDNDDMSEDDFPHRHISPRYHSTASRRYGAYATGGEGNILALDARNGGNSGGNVKLDSSTRRRHTAGDLTGGLLGSMGNDAQPESELRLQTQGNIWTKQRLLRWCSRSMPHGSKAMLDLVEQGFRPGTMGHRRATANGRTLQESTLVTTEVAAVARLEAIQVSMYNQQVRRANILTAPSVRAWHGLGESKELVAGVGKGRILREAMVGDDLRPLVASPEFGSSTQVNRLTVHAKNAVTVATATTNTSEDLARVAGKKGSVISGISAVEVSKSAVSGQTRDLGVSACYGHTASDEAKGCAEVIPPHTRLLATASGRQQLQQRQCQQSNAQEREKLEMLLLQKDMERIEREQQARATIATRKAERDAARALRHSSKTTGHLLLSMAHRIEASTQQQTIINRTQNILRTVQENKNRVRKNNRQGGSHTSTGQMMASSQPGGDHSLRHTDEDYIASSLKVWWGGEVDRADGTPMSPRNGATASNIDQQHHVKIHTYHLDVTPNLTPVSPLSPRESIIEDSRSALALGRPPLVASTGEHSLKLPLRPTRPNSGGLSRNTPRSRKSSKQSLALDAEANYSTKNVTDIFVPTEVNTAATTATVHTIATSNISQGASMLAGRSISSLWKSADNSTRPTRSQPIVEIPNVGTQLHTLYTETAGLATERANVSPRSQYSRGGDSESVSLAMSIVLPTARPTTADGTPVGRARQGHSSHKPAQSPSPLRQRQHGARAASAGQRPFSPSVPFGVVPSPDRRGTTLR